MEKVPGVNRIVRLVLNLCVLFDWDLERSVHVSKTFSSSSSFSLSLSLPPCLLFQPFVFCGHLPVRSRTGRKLQRVIGLAPAAVLWCYCLPPLLSTRKADVRSNDSSNDDATSYHLNQAVRTSAASESRFRKDRLVVCSDWGATRRACPTTDVGRLV